MKRTSIRVTRIVLAVIAGVACLFGSEQLAPTKHGSLVTRWLMQLSDVPSLQ
jgi:hypothetical protein